MRFKYQIFAVFSICATFMSCIKETHNNFVDAPNPLTNYVQFPKAFVSQVVEVSAEPVEATFYAELSSTDNSYPGTNITIAKSTAALTAYDPTLEYLPDTTYQLENTTATADSKSHLAAYKVKLFTNKIDLSHSYAMAFEIASTSNGTIAAGNKKTVVVGVTVKNKYDGVYMTRGASLRAGDAAKTGAFTPLEYSLVTYGANSVQFDKLQVWADDTGVGIGIPQLDVDPTTNNVTISSPGGAINNPTYPSRYDPSTKTFYISFTWGAGPASRLATDTLVYEHPR